MPYRGCLKFQEIGKAASQQQLKKIRIKFERMGNVLKPKTVSGGNRVVPLCMKARAASRRPCFVIEDVWQRCKQGRICGWSAHQITIFVGRCGRLHHAATSRLRPSRLVVRLSTTM